ncbi:MAG: RDD family protein [Rubrivivax sp.]
MSAPDPHSYLATSRARSSAYLLDLCACAALLIPTAYAAYCLGTPSAGTFEYALLFLAYHTYFLALRSGVSPGKHVLNIAVVTTSGRPMQVWQAMLRAGCLAMPWLLLAAGDSQWLEATVSEQAFAAVPTAGAAWLALDAILIELTRDRRSLTDRIAFTMVVALPPPQPHRAPAVPMFSAQDAEFGNPPRKPPP